MNENPDNRSHRSIKRIFSLEEKINYCTAWEKSEMDMVAFCKANRISRSALYQWSKKFKKGNNGFSPLVIEKKLPVKQAEMIQLNICFPNQMELSISMPDHRLVSFIQELDYAATVIQ